MPAFYRTYRPSTFKELVGQEHIVRTLENAITSDRIGHAYLFTGPRGTGKTTLARLLARAANCTDRQGAEPCGKCGNCTLISEGRSFDLIELDAATHTQVDKMREILESVPVPPVSARYKVYIVDEAHMLSQSAWNAFLKTLEEPPAHAIFILATTAPHKVPETIVSRCQRFDLSRFPIGKIVEKLSRIAEKEKIGIEDGALRMIAIAAEGGMRDAESLFSQVATLQESPITEADAAVILGVTETGKLESLAEKLADSDLPGAIRIVRDLSEAGENFSAFLPAFLRYLRILLLRSIDAEVADDDLAALSDEHRRATVRIADILSPERLVAIIGHFQDAENRLRITSLPELAIEIAVAKSVPGERKPIACGHTEQEEEEEVDERDSDDDSPAPDAGSDKPKDEAEKEGDPDETGPKLPKAEETSKRISETGTSRNGSFSVVDVRDRWHEIIREATRRNASLTLALSNASPREVRDGEVTLAVRFPFHRDRLVDPGNALTLATAFDTILSAKTRLTIIVEDPEKRETHPLVSHTLSTIGGQVI